MIKQILNSPRPIKRIISVFLDAVFVLLALWGALMLRLESTAIFLYVQLLASGIGYSPCFNCYFYELWLIPSDPSLFIRQGHLVDSRRGSCLDILS